MGGGGGREQRSYFRGVRYFLEDRYFREFKFSGAFLGGLYLRGSLRRGFVAFARSLLSDTKICLQT